MGLLVLLLVYSLTSTCPEPGGAPPQAGSDTSAAQLAAGAELLEGTEWRLVKLDDTSTFPTGNARQAHLMFRPEGTLTGADGCNSLRGSYKADGAALTIGPVMGTLMACSGLERRFLEALGATKKWKVSGNELTLLDGSDRPVATFEGWQP